MKRNSRPSLVFMVQDFTIIYCGPMRPGHSVRHTGMTPRQMRPAGGRALSAALPGRHVRRTRARCRFRDGRAAGERGVNLPLALPGRTPRHDGTRKAREENGWESRAGWQQPAEITGPASAQSAAPGRRRSRQGRRDLACGRGGHTCSVAARFPAEMRRFAVPGGSDRESSWTTWACWRRPPSPYGDSGLTEIRALASAGSFSLLGVPGRGRQRPCDPSSAASRNLFSSSGL